MVEILTKFTGFVRWTISKSELSKRYWNGFCRTPLPPWWKLQAEGQGLEELQAEGCDSYNPSFSTQYSVFFLVLKFFSDFPQPRWGQWGSSLSIHVDKKSPQAVVYLGRTQFRGARFILIQVKITKDYY